MQRQEKDPLGQMFAFILLHQNGTRKATCHLLASPTQFPWLRQLWGLRPLSSFTSTEAPDLSSSSTTSSRPFTTASSSGVRPRGGGHEARPTGSRRERTRGGKLASCASLKSHSHSPTQTLHTIWQKNARRNTRRGGSCCRWRSCD